MNHSIADESFIKVKGFAVEQNLLKSAKSGDADAQFRIGMQALKEKRLGYAEFFLRLADEHGHPKAFDHLMEICKEFNIKVPKVLLIEDDTIAQKVNQIFLKLLGCNVNIIDNGQQAVSLFKHYDLLLLDIGLPDINGIEVCKKIRVQEHGIQIPIIAITAYRDRSMERKIWSSGVNDLVLKPVLLKQMYQLLNNWLPAFTLRKHALY